MKTNLHWPHTVALVSLCLNLLVMPFPARAAARPDRLEQLTISIWPEYDRPGVLYIHRGQLPADAPLPAQISFRLPAHANGPSSTAVIDAEGKYRYEHPQVSQDADGILVSYDVAYPRFQLEYYDNALQIEGSGRRLEFAYRADCAIGRLTVEVKEPYSVTDFELNPAAESSGQAEDGLVVHQRNFGALAPGQQVHWSISYTKADPRLAVEVLSLPTPAPVAFDARKGLNSSARRPSRGWLAWGLWVVLALIGLGVVGLVVRAALMRPRRPQVQPAPVLKAPRRSRSASAGGAGPPKARRAPAAKAGPPRVRQARYCHQCGATLAQKDQFCRRCGTARRGAPAEPGE